MDGPKEIRWGAGLINLSVVYVIWGSTYLAIRVAVREGSGIDPFFLGASRTLVAGMLLLLWNALRNNRLRVSQGELAVLAVSGLLLWLGGNGLVNWAAQHADSGYAALLVGTMPIWVALIESVVDRKPPSVMLLGSLVLGFGGLGLLTYPKLHDAGRADVWAVIALLAAPLCWGAGSVLQTRRPVQLSPTASSAYQQLFGAVGFFAVSYLAGESAMNPVPEAWLAWIYLVIAGSLVAFTCFIFSLRILPTPVVMTYAYVNPVIAVFLGWLLLDEPVSGWTLGGAALILLGVAGVFRSKRA
ncbi:MAG: EamA family transporter [Myxococcota bacterium]|nr:EamA family transporter [Myxococcota bacterium]